MIRQCHNCRFAASDGITASCRAAPPRMETMPDGQKVTSFPFVGPTMWCGFHRFAWLQMIWRLFKRNGA